MHTFNTSHFRNRNFLKYLELTVYSLIAVILIGNLFELSGLVNLYNVTLLTLGTIFGLLVSVGWAPLTRKCKSEDPETLSHTANIQTEPKQDQKPSDHDENRHAA